VGEGDGIALTPEGGEPYKNASATILRVILESASRMKKSHVGIRSLSEANRGNQKALM